MTNALLKLLGSGVKTALLAVCPVLFVTTETSARTQVAPVDYFTASFEVTRISEWGERPNWSPDGKKIAFTSAEADGAQSYAFQLDLETGKRTCLTCHFGPEAGMVNPIYQLANGGFLVMQRGRAEAGEGSAHWLAGDLKAPPQPLGFVPAGDVAVSHRIEADGSVRIAWGQGQDGSYKLITANLKATGGKAALSRQRTVYQSSSSGAGPTYVEAYNIADHGAAITFWSVERSTMNGEMYKFEIATGKLTNISQDPHHNEAHLFPDERFGLEESNRASDPDGPLRGISTLPPQVRSPFLRAMRIPVTPEVEAALNATRGRVHPFDLYVVAYDGTKRVRRLTNVSDISGEAHQSQAAPDGRRIVFCLEAPDRGPFAGKSGLYIGTFR